MIIVAIKLFSIRISLGKIVLQVDMTKILSDKIIQPISSTFIHILVLISKQKHLC
jgi:hypothetical protein